MTLRNKKIMFLLAMLIAIPLAIFGLQSLIGSVRDENSFGLSAQAAADKGDWGALQKLAEEWQRIYPRSAMAYAALGDSHYRQAHLPEAINSYQMALQINPNMSEVWARFGASLFNSGRYGDAIAACGNSIKLKPDYSDPWLCQGLAYAFMGDVANANMVQEKLLDIAPDRASQMREVVRINACPIHGGKLGNKWCAAK